MFELGKKYLFRFVTNYLTGEVVAITGNLIKLKSAAWIPDTGRFSEALKGGNLSEVEPYPGKGEVIANLDSLVDASEWFHDLPRDQK